MSECAVYTQRETKNCSVVLERLNETFLNQYVKKSGLKINVDFLESIENLKYCGLKTKNDTTTLQKVKNAREQVITNGFKRKKRKNKPLCYSDDEDCPNKPVNKESRLISCIEGNGVAIVCQQQSLKISKSRNSKVRGEKHNKLKTTGENSERLGSKSKEGISNIEDAKNAITLRNILYDSHYERNANYGFPLGSVSSDVEIIEEFLKPRSAPSGNRNVDATVRNHLQCGNSIISGSDRGRDLEEYDSREESEDDKKTVIFEEGQHKVTKPEIFDVNEKEIEWASRKLTNKDITNRKKPRLIKFKRKSMTGRNSAPVRKFLETCTNGREVADAEVSVKGVSEDCLKEVCYLVKSLNELHKIILHQKNLFRELSNRDELFVHFSKVINAQQENFQKEIMKSQRTIIRCYENMLVHQKPPEVALEISKRTALTVDEVTFVLSQCLRVETACEIEKSRNGVIEKGLFQAHKYFYNSDIPQKTSNENSTKNAWSGQKTNYSVFPSHPYLSSEFIPELVQELINKPVRGNSLSDSQCLTERLAKNPLPPTDGVTPNVEKETLKSYWIPKNWTQKSHSKIWQPYQGFSPDHPSLVMQHFNNKNEVHGLNYLNQNLRSSSNYSPNVGGLPQFSRFLVPPASFTPVRGAEFPVHHGHILNRIPEKTPINHHAQENIYISSCGSGVPVVPNGVGNVAGFNMVAPQNHLFNNVFPSRIHKTGNDKSHVLTSPDEIRCPLDAIFTDSVRQQPHLPYQLLLSPHELTKNRGTGAPVVDPPEFLEKKVLDPTVPLKLTMKNYRLQAEPITLPAGTETSEEIDDLNLWQSLKDENIDNYGFPDPGQEDSKTRAYICARSDCKKSGTRICKGCQSVIYCSETCQLKHWTQKHKAECYQLKQLRQ